jgi:hypothetical protein
MSLDRGSMDKGDSQLWESSMWLVWVFLLLIAVRDLRMESGSECLKMLFNVDLSYSVARYTHGLG